MIKSIKNHCRWLLGKLNIFGNTTRSIKREAQQPLVTRDTKRDTVAAPVMLRVYKVQDPERFDLRMSCIHDGYF